MNMVQNLMERLRPLVGLKGWDFCLLWKLSEDQRLLEWMDCCCGGTDGGGEDQLQFSAVSPIPHCRDGMFQHPTTKSCELLSQLPTTLSLDEPGIHAEALISNFPRWLNFSTCSGSSLHEETVGTRVLIPVPGGLIELFVAKQVPEDQQVVDIVKSQYSSIMMGHQEAENFSASVMSTGENERHFHPQPSPATALETLNLSSYDFSGDRICSSPMNLLQHFSYSNEENRTKSNNNNNRLFFEGEDQNGGDHHHHHHEEVEFGESTAGKEQQGNDDKEGMKHEMNGRSDSISDCSDQNGEDDQQQQYGNNNKHRRKNGRPEAKNLQAERRRRKRLNGRLYDLRAIVPIISDLKKSTIIVDAIEYVKELKRQAKELEEELEANSDDEEISRNSFFNNNNNTNSNGMPPTNVLLNEPAGPDGVSGLAKLANPESEINHEKGQQMEVQVEVAQIDGNGFFVKVFCEHRPGGFVRLLEALDSLGLEVTNANVTSCKSLVSNVFRVQKKDSEMVQAEYVRDSLLELTRDPLPRTWTEIQVKGCENGNGLMENHHHPNNYSNHHHNHHQVLQNGHIMNSNHLYPQPAPQLNMSFSNLI